MNPRLERHRLQMFSQGYFDFLHAWLSNQTNFFQAVDWSEVNKANRELLKNLSLVGFPFLGVTKEKPKKSAICLST